MQNEIQAEDIASLCDDLPEKGPTIFFNDDVIY